MVNGGRCYKEVSGMSKFRKWLNVTLNIKDILRSRETVISEDTFILNKSQLGTHKLY